MFTVRGADHSDTVQKLLSMTMYVVEMSNCEKLDFWRKVTERGHKWEQHSKGHCERVGQIKILKGAKITKHDVWMSIHWERIDGRVVAFWEATSAIVDYDMCRAWWKKHCAPKELDGRLATSDAMNAWHSIHEIQRQNEAAAKTCDKL